MVRIALYSVLIATLPLVSSAGEWRKVKSGQYTSSQYIHDDGTRFTFQCKDSSGVMFIEGDFPVAKHVEIVFRYYGELHRERWGFDHQNLISVFAKHSKFDDWFFSPSSKYGRKFLIAGQEYRVHDPDDINTWLEVSFAYDDCDG